MLLLNQRCMEVQSELTTAESKIKASADVESLRKLAMKHAWLLASNMVSNLIGIENSENDVTSILFFLKKFDHSCGDGFIFCACCNPFSLKN